jgi:SAM-dependent methyltransferase
LARADVPQLRRSRAARPARVATARACPPTHRSPRQTLTLEIENAELFLPPDDGHLFADSSLSRFDRGLEIRYDVGDAEAPPYEDGSFDVVVSCFGVMFAPDHRAAAGELKRVCRRGGRLGLACWTPEGGIGDMFGMLASFQPPPPPEAGNPLEWPLSFEGLR